MKKRLLTLLTVACLLFIYTQTFAGVDDSTVGVDSAVEAASTPGTPVAGIGVDLANAYENFMGAIVAATSGLGSALTGSFKGLAQPILGLYFAIMAIRLIRGDTDVPKQALTTMLLAACVTQIVFGSGTYQEYVSGPIIGTINGVANFLVSKATGGQAGSMIMTLANGMDKIMAACVQLDRIDSWWPQKLLAALIAQILLSSTYLMIMITFLLISIMTWFGIYLLNVFGAVCLFFAIFNPTRHIFWAWLRAMCNYGLVIVFASLILAVCLKIMGPQLEILTSMDYGKVHPLLNGPTYMCVAINVLSWCMLLKAPDFAAALSGGSAGNTAGIAGVVSMTAGAVYGGAQWAMARGVTRHFGGGEGSSGGGAVGSIARGAGNLASGAGLGPSARKGIDNSSY